MTERTIFLAALAWDDPARRAAYLDGACAGDAELRRRVEDLLRAHPHDPCAVGEAASAAGAAEVTRRGDETPGGEPIGLGFLAPSDDPDSLGRLGHYDVRQVLGRGGFGVVLRAFDQKLHRPVAVKVLAPYLAASGTARQRFLREARAAAAVRHENVVDIHAVEDVPVPYLVMEYVAGETLQRRLDREGPLPPREVMRVGAQAARGLAAAHAQGLIHRDVKPANILLEDDGGRVKLTDFGLARATDDASLTASGAVTGTPSYMAPEQALAEAVDHRADLFSLGSTLYALCTGQPPFRAGTSLGVLKRVSEDEPPPIREVNPAVPARLCDVIARLLAKRPEARFQSAGEVADLLEKCLAETDGGPTAPEPPPAVIVEEDAAPPAAWSRRRSRWIVVATAAAALVAAVALAEAAGFVPVGRTLGRMFASAPAVANDQRGGEALAVAPPQGAPDRLPPRDGGAAPALIEPPLPHAPPPVVEVTTRTPIDLPGAFDEVRTGAGGRLLIFHPRQEKKLVVVDVCKGRVAGEIPLHDEAVRFAAGRDKLLVVLVNQKVIERWDLHTLAQDGVFGAVPDGGKVVTAAMGCDSDGPLALWAGDAVTLLDVARMRPLKIDGPELHAGADPRYGFELRASADGRTFIGWVPGLAPSKFTVLHLAAQGATQTTLDGDSYRDRWALPTADGRLVFRSDQQAAEGRVLLPTTDPRFFLATHDQEVAICTSCDRQTRFKVNDEALRGMDADPVTTHRFLVNHDEPRVRYLPDARLLVFLPEGDRQVVVRPFDLITELNKSEKDYLFVTSLPNTRARAGQLYTYRLEVTSKAAGPQFLLGLAPNGMRLSADGELSWKVPAGQAGQKERVVVTVRDEAGTSVVHSFEIEVE